jgi:serine/threonine protein kinase
MNVPPPRAPVPGRVAKYEKVSDSAHSQYLLDGHPVFGEPYARQHETPQLSREQRAFAQDTQSTVYQRHNPNSPVLVKVARFPFESTAKELDDIALTVLTQADKDIASHFALEVRHDKLKDGKACALTRKVNGFTLKQYFENPRLASSMSVDTLKEKLNDLQTAVDWLNAQGFRHNDIHKGNVMIDLDSGKLVLIDFGMAERIEEDLPLKDDFEPLLEFVDKQIATHGESYRGRFAQAHAQEDSPARSPSKADAA